MAIETTVKLSENRSLDGAYIKINNCLTYKREVNVNKGSEKEPEIVAERQLKGRYDIEIYSENGGTLLKACQSPEFDYSGGDIWEESYKHLKTDYPKSKDI